MFETKQVFGSLGGGGGGTEMRLNCRCKSVCDFSDELFAASLDEYSIEVNVVVPSFEVVVSLWFSSALGIGMSTKHTASLIPFDACASLIFSELAVVLGASTVEQLLGQMLIVYRIN